MTSMDLTLLVCTYNRARDLDELLASIVGQSGLEEFSAEVIVVDNNSSDDTHSVVEQARGRTLLPLRYVLEPRQGKSYALNRGLQEATGAVVAIIDDDQVLPPTYLRQLVTAFRDRPNTAFIGGKVLPVWETSPPSWLTQDHWGPLGMLDHGDEPFVVNAARPICLLTCAFRREDLRSVGGYREQLGVSGSSIGSTEDADILERLWTSGREGYYLPTLQLLHKAPAGRMTRKYYRRWHRGHGRFESLRRSPVVEATRLRIFDVPLHMYRQAVADVFGYGAAAITGRRAAAFERETRLCFFRGFASQRLREYTRSLTRLLRPRSVSRSEVKLDIHSGQTRRG